MYIRWRFVSLRCPKSDESGAIAKWAKGSLSVNKEHVMQTT